jgi:hypothetical protein
VGDVGIVWGFYNSDPPMYEVSFTDSDGTTFDFTVDEEEICKVDGVEPEPGGLGLPQSQSVDWG